MQLSGRSLWWGSNDKICDRLRVSGLVFVGGVMVTDKII